MKHNSILHYFLKDKKNYHRDEELSHQWETYLFYLAHVRQMSWQLIKKKFFYFIKFKKIYLTKVIILFTILFSGAFYGGKWLINHNSFFEVKRIVTAKKLDTVYVPDTISLSKYIKKISKSLSTDSASLVRRLAFVTYYTQDSTKNAERFLKMLAELESHQNIKAENGLHWGEWQMGKRERELCGFGGISKKDYLGSYNIQKANAIIYIKRNYVYLKPYLDKYDNRIIRGYHLTRSGMLAMSHNCGADGFIKFLNSNCTYVPHDGNIPSTNYLTLGNYNIKELLVDF